MIEKQNCPKCGQPVDEIKWEPTLIPRGRVVEGCVLPPEPTAPWEEQLINVPPGVFTALPCGHEVGAETGKAIFEAYGSKASR